MRLPWRNASISIRRASAAWLTTASLAANFTIFSPLARVSSQRRRSRSSSGSVPSSARSSAPCASTGEHEVRKPSRPRFTPRMGTPRSATSAAPRRSVPSPPSTTRRSTSTEKLSVLIADSCPRAATTAASLRAISCASGFSRLSRNPTRDVFNEPPSLTQPNLLRAEQVALLLHQADLTRALFARAFEGARGYAEQVLRLGEVLARIERDAHRHRRVQAVDVEGARGFAEPLGAHQRAGEVRVREQRRQLRRAVAGDEIDLPERRHRRGRDREQDAVDRLLAALALELAHGVDADQEQRERLVVARGA